MFFFVGPRPFCINKEKEKPTTHTEEGRKKISLENNDFVYAVCKLYILSKRRKSFCFLIQFKSTDKLSLTNKNM